MKERISKLISVKSIVTIILTAVFAVLALRDVLSTSQFITIYTVIIGFYFGTQAAKEDKK